MEEVARTENVRLVNARPALDEDPSIYLDFCHPDAGGHRKVARLLADAVREMHRQDFYDRSDVKIRF